jgi:putative endonuclease
VLFLNTHGPTSFVFAGGIEAAVIVNLLEIASDFVLAMTLNMKTRHVYILTNKNNTTLYVGVTSNLVQRIQRLKDYYYPISFSARYNLNKLVYYEVFQMIGDAITREKQLKAGNRAKKVALIEAMNLEWKDLIIENA